MKSINDAGYWNDVWTRKIIKYNAPVKIPVTRYLTYKDIPEITEIANKIIQVEKLSNNATDTVPLAVLEWLEAKFHAGDYSYVNDSKEYWQTPEETLSLKEGDCDDWGILEYFIIREIFKIFGKWDTVKHRLKCVAGNVNEYGEIPSVVGGHFYLIWLHSDRKWYTVETTYYRFNAIGYYGARQHKDNPAYGVIWFTFNEDHSWAQNSMIIEKQCMKKEVKKMAKKELLSPRFSLDGWNVGALLKSNWKTIREILKWAVATGVPLYLVGKFSVWQVPITLLLKFLLDLGHYYFKEQSE